MARVHIESANGEVHVQFTIESDSAVVTPFNSHLIKDALVYLIQEADLDLWEKHDAELQPDAFWGALLAAVARSYRASRPVPFEEKIGNADVLRELIDGLDMDEYP